MSKDKDGNPCFLVNGEKKWITNGIWADYFVVAGIILHDLKLSPDRWPWNEWNFTFIA